MSIQLVREYLKSFGKAEEIIELSSSSATVELAADALGVKPGQIAKSLSFRHGDRAIMVVCSGSCKIDNHKFKMRFALKPHMLSVEDVKLFTNHHVGGVCPFGVTDLCDIYLDVSLKAYEYVYPACGSEHSAIRLRIDELEKLTPYKDWVDVCKEK